LREKREKRFLFFCSSLSSSVRYKKQKKKKKEMKRSHQGGRLLLQRILLIQHHHHHQQHQQQLLFPRVLAASSSSSFSSAAAEVHTNKYGAKTNATTTTMRISYPAFQVWGSNTGVGKTLVSGGLIKAASSSKGNSDDFENSSCLYLKPVQTGFPEDSDAQFVFDCSGSNSSSSNSSDDDEKSKGRVTTGAHAAKCTDTATTDNDSDNNNSNKIWCHTEFAWKVAAGPHVAEKLEGRPVTDEDVVNAVRNRLEEFYNINNNNNNRKFALVETAGGVASPSSSGNLQSNVLARCRLPAILVGDGRLGGVSVTLTSYESYF
jgi:dethiobiotin synthetase/adenosylmethionine--8-amino-7-oxononanoate aminotransferase